MYAAKERAYKDDVHPDRQVQKNSDEFPSVIPLVNFNAK
jgi:hypothetical protein